MQLLVILAFSLGAIVSLLVVGMWEERTNERKST